MNPDEFVDRCRREWRRLRVPDEVAEEMAAELQADLEEAAADGVPAEELLGDGALDAPGFAASWARERGVVPESRRPTPLLALAAGVAVAVAVAVALVGVRSTQHAHVASTPALPTAGSRLTVVLDPQTGRAMVTPVVVGESVQALQHAITLLQQQRSSP